MCYTKADELLKRTERRWVQADAAINFFEMPGKPLEFWTKKAHEHLDALVDYINADADLCCLDVYLRLEADIEKMCRTFGMLTGARPVLEAVA